MLSFKQYINESPDALMYGDNVFLNAGENDCIAFGFYEDILYTAIDENLTGKDFNGNKGNSSHYNTKYQLNYLELTQRKHVRKKWHRHLIRAIDDLLNAKLDKDALDNARLTLKPAGRIWVDEMEVTKPDGTIGNVRFISFWSQPENIHIEQVLNRFRLNPDEILVEFPHIIKLASDILKNNSSKQKPLTQEEEKEEIERLKMAHVTPGRNKERMNSNAIGSNIELRRARKAGYNTVAQWNAARVFENFNVKRD
jgi:hypothetical protein